MVSLSETSQVLGMKVYYTQRHNIILVYKVLRHCYWKLFWWLL